MIEPKGILNTVIGESVRNWVIDGAIEGAMPYVMFVPEGATGVRRYHDASGTEIPFRDESKGKEISLLYMEAMFLLRTNPQACRAFIIGGAQGLYSLITRIPFARILPFQRFPKLEPATKFVLEQLGETLEQLPDSLRAYAAHQDHLPFPEDFKTREAREVFADFMASFKAAIESKNAEMLEHFKQRVPLLEDKFSLIDRVIERIKGNPTSAHQHLLVLEVFRPDLYPDWIARIGKIPDDAEDDLQRIDTILTPMLIATFLKMELEEMVNVVRRLAHDTIHEQIEGAVGGVVGAANEVLDEVSKAIKGRREARAARRTARLSGRTRPIATARVVPDTGDAIEVEVMGLTESQRRAFDA